MVLTLLILIPPTRTAVAMVTTPRAQTERINVGLSVEKVELESVAAPTGGLQAIAAPVTLRASTANPSLYRGGTGKKLATIEFWMELAYCETKQDWSNRGQYAGGLGIYRGTWNAWGGKEFAPRPDLATIAEQIIVANRISTQGWVRPDGTFSEPVWFTGWGALPCVGRPRLVPLSSPLAYMDAHVGSVNTTLQAPWNTNSFSAVQASVAWLFSR